MATQNQPIPVDLLSSRCLCGGRHMCRLMLYLGPETRLSSLIVEPRHSLIRQSVHSEEREEPLNGDGFGIGWYASEHELGARRVPLDHAGLEQPQPAEPGARRRRATACSRTCARRRSRAASTRRTAIRFAGVSICACTTATSATFGSCAASCSLPFATTRSATSTAARTPSTSLRCSSTRCSGTTSRDPALRMAQALARAISRALELVRSSGRRAATAT